MSAEPAYPDEEGIPTPRDSPEGLTRAQAELLAFESRWWRSAGAKQQAMRDELDLTSTQYYRRLAELLDNPAAAREHPALVGRLRRARDARRRSRTSR